MKRLTISTLALFAAGPAFAQPALNSCADIPELATLVMTRRQVNYDIMLMINYMKLEITEQKPWRQLGAFARII